MGKIIKDAKLVSEGSRLCAVLGSERLHRRAHTRRICTSGEYFLAFQNGLQCTAEQISFLFPSFLLAPSFVASE